MSVTARASAGGGLNGNGGCCDEGASGQTPSDRGIIASDRIMGAFNACLGKSKS